MIDLQTKRNRLHKGDIWQNYNGEPTLLSLFIAIVIFLGLVTAYFLTQI